MPPGQRKLRDSCDACHIAKVKCIKTETGECLRCVSSSTVCSFSPSDRRGKPRGAKNKCNRVPPQDSVQTESNPKSNPAPPAPAKSVPDDGYSSPNYDVDRYFAANGPSADMMSDAWAFASAEEVSQAMDLSPHDDAMASMFQNEWMNINSAMLSTDPQMLQNHPPPATHRTSLSNLYPDPMLGSPSPLGPQPQTQPPYQESDIFEALSVGHLQQPSARCKCGPVSLQSLYTLHSQAISASSGSSTPLDVALFINNRAIERCHTMLSCTECVLGPDTDKSSASMLMLAGTMDDILASYGTTCIAYLDGAALDPLVFSSGDSTTGSSLSGSPKMEPVTGMSSRAQSISSHYSGTSSATTLSMHASTPSSQFSLGTYRVEGEDGRHLKLEILKIELRKMERLWAVFRDTCAYQQCQDDQKSLYAALVCYLAKRLRNTADVLESRRRNTGCAW